MSWVMSQSWLVWFNFYDKKIFTRFVPIQLNHTYVLFLENPYSVQYWYRISVAFQTSDVLPYVSIFSLFLSPSVSSYTHFQSWKFHTNDFLSWLRSHLFDYCSTVNHVFTRGIILEAHCLLAGGRAGERAGFFSGKYMQYSRSFSRLARRRVIVTSLNIITTTSF